jgi:hypothetical protein
MKSYPKKKNGKKVEIPSDVSHEKLQSVADGMIPNMSTVKKKSKNPSK